MPTHRNRFITPVLFSVILMAGFFLLLPAMEATAQCGSQASSCKNCHETQGEDPVNADGTTWHTQHTQIDACVSCHAGNPQSTDKLQSHTGMVSWYSDVKAGCFACHPDNYILLAQEYATSLGVTLGEVSSAPTPDTPESTSVTTTTVETIPSGGGMVIDQPGTIDYVQQYNETVLGEHPINWGDVILVVMILSILLGGGVFVYWNERRRRGLKGFFTAKADKIPQGEVIPVVAGYTSEVTELLPLIAKLNPVGKHSLKRILSNPEQANEMLHTLSHLDPDLVKRVQELEKDSRALLMAIAGS